MSKTLYYRVLFTLPDAPGKAQSLNIEADSPAEALKQAKQQLTADGYLIQDSWFYRVWGSTGGPAPDPDPLGGIAPEYFEKLANMLGELFDKFEERRIAGKTARRTPPLLAND